MLTDLWKHRYKVAISNCNVFLENVTPVTELINSGGSFVSAEKKSLDSISKIHACFLLLSKCIRNIPINDKPLGAEDENAITKADKEEVQKCKFNVTEDKKVSDEIFVTKG